MRLVTGNDLKTGDVVWWTGDGWSRSIADAILVEPGDGPDQADGIIHRTGENSHAVSEAWEIEAEATSDGPRPLHIKERMRALGPSVRPDLGVQSEGDVHVSL
ncbi:MAG: DUF2849 domain-containing protein [Pacificimonas sp.]